MNGGLFQLKLSENNAVDQKRGADKGKFCYFIINFSVFRKTFINELAGAR